MATLKAKSIGDDEVKVLMMGIEQASRGVFRTSENVAGHWSSYT